MFEINVVEHNEICSSFISDKCFIRQTIFSLTLMLNSGYIGQTYEGRLQSSWIGGSVPLLCRGKQ
jgi:hypothetical protein